MLCINNYTKEYIDECRVKVGDQIATYRNLINTVTKQSIHDEIRLNAAIESFEPVFFNNMVMVLDNLFVHRSRLIEKKDGNPLNEVRMLCHSMMYNNYILTAESTIKFNPAKSVLKYQPGDEIRLTEDAFVELSKAYFDEIEKKYL
jgi:hypothetical protein